MSKMRSTEFPSNKDLKTPGPADIRTEINIQTDELERMDFVSEFMSNFVDPQGNMKESRILTKEEERGRQEILEGIKTKGWILYNSDKSGKLVIDSKDNYLKAVREHFIKDPVITLEDTRKAEKLLNNHARSWVRIFNIGDSIGQRKRCTRALM